MHISSPTQNDTDPIPLSALNQWSYCPRRCCLIHMEGEFADNIHTARGTAEHRRADEGRHETTGDRTAETALPVWSDRLGLVGKCDVVEFLADGTPYPVEYKHGARKKWMNDDIQLAAQAMCLEEMTGRSVPFGAIYHASSRRRREVAITEELKQAVETCITEVRAALREPTLPPPLNDHGSSASPAIDGGVSETNPQFGGASLRSGSWRGSPRILAGETHKRCRECSLAELCQPAALTQRERQRRLAETLFTLDEGGL